MASATAGLILGATLEMLKSARNRSLRPRSKKQGAVLLSVLALCLILATLTGACAYVLMSYNSLGVAQSNADTATALAEAGVNAELNYIAVQTQAGSSSWYHSNATQTGQPFPGNPGTPQGSTWIGPAGQYWVYTTPVSASNAAAGFTITCVAEVGGKVVTNAGTTTLSGGSQRTVSITGTTNSLNNLYGTFAGSSSSTTPAITIASGGSLTTNGVIGTNGYVQNNGTETHTTAINGNCNSSSCAGHQFSGSVTCATYSEPLPSVPTVCDTLFPSCTHGSEYTYLANHNNNCNIKMYKEGCSAGTSISASSTMTANVSSTQTTLCNNSNSGACDSNCWWYNTYNGFNWWWWENNYQYTPNNGDWSYENNNQGCNHIPGSTTCTALILPPGDYYFSACDCSTFNSNTKIIFDNADLCEGGVNAGKPIRVWFGTCGTTNGNTDCINLPITYTDTTATSCKTCRVYYGKDNCSLQLQNSGSSSCTHNCGVYACSGGSHGATVSLCGGSNSSKCLNICGSCVADHVSCSGNCCVSSCSGNCTSYDYPGGTGYLTTGSYSCR